MALDLVQLAPELGQFALILSLCLSAALFVLPLVGAHYGSNVLMQSGRSLATGFFVFVAFAFCCLVYSFLHDDFSVKYVASNSNSLLPYYYKISAEAINLVRRHSMNAMMNVSKKNANQENA